MRRLLTASIALIALTATASAAVVPRFLAGDVTVTVTYNGKGKVDDTHEILVFLFDHPNPGQGSVPLALPGDHQEWRHGDVQGRRAGVRST